MLHDLGVFLKSVFTHWFSGMCGVLTVGLTCASPWVDTGAAQKILIATASASYLAAAFSTWRREHGRASRLENQVAGQGKLEIEFFPGVRRYEDQKMGLYDNITRTLSVRVINVGGSPVKECRLYLMSVDPNEGNLAEPVLMPGQSADLNPGEFFFRPIATYGEPGPHVSGNSFGHLHLPFRPEVLDGGGERTMGKETDYLIILRATGAGSIECDRKFKVWISQVSKLRMVAMVD